MNKNIIKIALTLLLAIGFQAQAMELYENMVWIINEKKQECFEKNEEIKKELSLQDLCKSTTITKETQSEKTFRTNKDAVYLYAPGFLANATQTGKYSREFICKETNETIASKNGMQVLGDTIYVSKGNEVTTKDKNQTFSWNPAQWIWHNLCYKIAGGANEKFGISVKSNDESSTTVAAQSINLLNLRIGLNEDAESVISTFKKMVSENKDKDIVLYGVSRGTAAINNALPELIKLKDFSRVKGIVLEGAFDSMEHVYTSRFPFIAKIISFKTANKLIMLLTGTDQSQNNPCETLKKTLQENSKNMPPILMVSSNIDKDVPYECTKNLYETNKELGNIELITLNKSLHPSYMFDDHNDRKTYYTGVHAFYKKNGLPCIEN